ncbi:MAG: hypothetical protein IMZ53_01615 [Thermoplasmata archaeon]|nr:hypothetical protein [Thermoplasmata archaeon]
MEKIFEGTEIKNTAFEFESLGSEAVGYCQGMCWYHSCGMIVPLYELAYWDRKKESPS